MTLLALLDFVPVCEIHGVRICDGQGDIAALFQVTFYGGCDGVAQPERECLISIRFAQH